MATETNKSMNADLRFELSPYRRYSYLLLAKIQSKACRYTICYQQQEKHFKSRSKSLDCSPTKRLSTSEAHPSEQSVQKALCH
jgi:hypothetical protein